MVRCAANRVNVRENGCEGAGQGLMVQSKHEFSCIAQCIALCRQAGLKKFGRRDENG
jgi:hypothetical protein